MPSTVVLVQILIRALGAFLLLSGALQLTIAVALIAVIATAAHASPNSPLGFIGVCAMQMGIFSLGSVVVGGVLLRASGPLARFSIRSVLAD